MKNAIRDTVPNTALVSQQKKSVKKTVRMKFLITKMFPSVWAIFVVLSNPAMGAPAPLATIDNPCRTLPFLVETLPPLKTQFTATINAINTANYSAHEFMTAHIGNGFLTAEVFEAWAPENMNLVGLPLSVEVDNFTSENMTDFLLQAYHDLSIHIIYVQQALRELTNFDRADLERKTSLLETNLLRLLCKVNILLKTKGETITSFVDASVMPDMLKNIQDDTVRYVKSYILGKDVKVFLGNLKSNYIALLDEVQT